MIFIDILPCIKVESTQVCIQIELFHHNSIASFIQTLQLSEHPLVEAYSDKRLPTENVMLECIEGLLNSTMNLQTSTALAVGVEVVSSMMICSPLRPKCRKNFNLDFHFLIHYVGKVWHWKMVDNCKPEHA